VHQEQYSRIHIKNLKRKLRGLPPLERTNQRWFCPICGTDRNKSKHHVEPYRLKRNNSRINISLICRSCHDLVEKAYDDIISQLFPTLWLKSRELHNVERNLAYFCNELMSGRDMVPESRWISTGLPRTIPLEDAIALQAECRRQVQESQKLLYEACLGLDWNLIYSSVKSSLRIQLGKLPSTLEYFVLEENFDAIFPRQQQENRGA
jgi:hypothetical protein